MSQLLYGSICVSDLPQNKMKQGKNGKWYLDINVWINDQLDQYGNIAGVSIGQTKEEREAKVKRIYIGNLKTPNQSAPASPAAYPGAPAAPAAPAGYAPAPQPTAPNPKPTAPPAYAPAPASYQQQQPAGYQQPAPTASAAPAPAYGKPPF